MDRQRTVLLALAIALLCLPMPGFVASAQQVNALCIGTFHSPKGFGLSIQTQTDDISFDSISLTADLRGVVDGEYSKPGFKATATRDLIFSSFVREGMDIDLYAGPGLTAGYVHDADAPLQLMAGVAGAFGARFTFERHFTVCLELGCDLALRIWQDERFGNIKLSTYKSGICDVALPQVLINWRF